MISQGILGNLGVDLITPPRYEQAYQLSKLPNVSNLPRSGVRAAWNAMRQGTWASVGPTPGSKFLKETSSIQA